MQRKRMQFAGPPIEDAGRSSGRRTPRWSALGAMLFTTSALTMVCPVMADEQRRTASAVQFPPDDAPLDLTANLNAMELPGTRLGTLPPPVGGTLWIAQGPGPIINGQVENVLPNNEVVGAVHAVAAHPTDANILYIGTVNGGIWRTTNATSSSATWLPLTDDLPSLSIGALEFDPTDATNMTLLAGIGRFSSLGRRGGAHTGLLRTTNGGGSWVQLAGGGTLLDKNISGVAIRGNTIVVSVNFAIPFEFPEIGIFRSTNGGASFTQVSSGTGAATGLPGGVSYDLASDPTDPTTLYTNINFADIVGGVNGIYRSTNTGATWTRVSNAAMDALIVSGETSNVEMSVGNAGQVYAAILNFGQLRNGGIFRSGDAGATWTAMDIPLTNEAGGDVGTNPTFKPDAGAPGGQGATHFSILADRTDEDIVYVGGDRQPAGFNDCCGFPNGIGAFDFSGRLFRGDASKPPGTQWVHLTHSNSLGAAGGGTANSSAPHADSREMVFDANGNIIEVDDGGVYCRTNPQDNTGDWFSLNGNLRSTEFHDIAYDTISNIIIGGAQDNGTPQQITSGAITWDIVSGGDGGDVAADVISAFPNSIRYSSFQFLGGFRKRVYDENNALISEAFPSLTLVGGGAELITQFYTPIELNARDPMRLIIGGENSVYESLNQGGTIREVGPGIPVNDSLEGDAIAYGGSLDGVGNLNILYIGSDASVFVRIAAAPAPLLATAYPGVFPIDIVLDPDDWMTAYVADRAGMVFRTTNAGASWTDITGDLVGVGEFRSIEFIPGVNEEVVVGADHGVFVSPAGSLGIWNQLGTNLPNAPVYDLDYDPVDDVLVVGTLGRGAFLAYLACVDNGTPEFDCNNNSVADACDIAAGTSEDCNANTIPDSCDLTDGTSLDCNTNTVLDECDIADGTSVDCNANTIPDTCDFADGTSLDCNTNAVPDECDIADGTSVDCNANTIPDTCDLADGTSLDCNTNTSPDECDIDSGVSDDLNGNGVPDECEFSPPLGADPPHNTPKNRFVSINPNNSGPIAMKVELLDLACGTTGKKCTNDVDCKTCLGGTKDGLACSIPSECPGGGTCEVSGETCVEQSPPVMLGWVSAPITPNPSSNAPTGMATSIVQRDMPALRVWSEPVVHIGDCEIAPAQSYGISVSPDGVTFSTPLRIGTVAKPSGKEWGDMVTTLEEGAFTPPNGVLNVNDLSALIAFFQGRTVSNAELVVTTLELSPETPTFFINASDLQEWLKAFGGGQYPPPSFPNQGGPAGCP